MIIGSDINTAGYQYAGFKSDTCTACGICYYICPEPEALTVVQGDKEGANE
jgi:NAD-dependent dihydropyrimidine dehydrogenase PreA subunit